MAPHRHRERLRLRRARAQDAAAIRRLVMSERLNPLGIDWKRFQVLVDSAGKVHGCGQVKRHDAGFQELASLVVSPAYRQLGYGRQMIESLMATTEAELWLMCRSTLIPLYEKFGFVLVEPEAPQPAYYRRVRRLASVFHTLASTGESLAVMRRRSVTAPRNRRR